MQTPDFMNYMARLKATIGDEENDDVEVYRGLEDFKPRFDRLSAAGSIQSRLSALSVSFRPGNAEKDRSYHQSLLGEQDDETKA